MTVVPVFKIDGAATPDMPPPEFRRFAGLPWRWWRHLPHWHIPVFYNEVGHIKCAICWKRWEKP